VNYFLLVKGRLPWLSLRQFGLDSGSNEKYLFASSGLDCNINTLVLIQYRKMMIISYFQEDTMKDVQVATIMQQTHMVIACLKLLQVSKKNVAFEVIFELCT